MECCFHDTFYSPQQDILVANLMNTKQLADESITKFLEWFRRMRSKCNVQFLESEYATIVIGNMTAQL